MKIRRSMSLQLTLLFDGGNSISVPAAWAGHTLAQLKTDVYGYAKQELMSYRQAGCWISGSPRSLTCY